jgi:hypothetical protein
MLGLGFSIDSILDFEEWTTLKGESHFVIGEVHGRRVNRAAEAPATW